MLATYVHHIWVCPILITLCGDIEKNPGPKPSSCDSFSICHWNLKSISVHNFIKISLLHAYVSTHHFDILCLLETYLDSHISSNDNNLTIPGYDLYIADHPSNVKLVGEWRGGDCIYRNFLLLKLIDIQYLQECINFELKIRENYVISLFYIVHQTNLKNEFETFLKNFELNLDTILANNPFLTVFLGDFNAKSSLWCKSDNTSYEGSKIEGITSQLGL